MRKVIAGLLFGLTAVFFITSYFGITTSGEDVFQGAGTTPAVLEDAKAAFAHNARIPDMYAWSVINFFDYQYSFGIDTIFRLIDVALGIGMLYLITYIILGRKLEFELKDALIWTLCFLMLFLTPHGRVLYAGFSAIHNYLLIAIISLGFTLPYLRKLRGAKINSTWWRAALMLLAGLAFGLSSNLTPIAFLLTFALILIIQTIHEKSLRTTLKHLETWEILGILGILIGMAIAYLGGPGVSDYLQNGYATEYNYISLETLFTAPGSSIISLAKHLINNTARVLLPALALLATVAIIRLLRKKFKPNSESLVWWPPEKSTQNLLIVLAIFITFHILIATQLNAPIRILLPAYLAAIIMTMALVQTWTSHWQLNILSLVILLLTFLVVGTKIALTVNYHQKSNAILKKIQNSTEPTICITREEVHSSALPIIYLGQEDMLADWAMPAKIYNKEITWCE